METQNLLKNWQLNAGASDDALGGAVSSLGCSLPSDYLQFLRNHDGGEGFIGDNYLILWKTEELSKFHRECEIDQYAPSLLLIGSDGGGEGYGFDTRDATMPVVRVPFVGLDLRYVTPVATSFTDLLVQLGKRRLTTSNTSAQHGQARPIGLELFEITPVILGGDPIDLKNKTWLSRQQHIEAVRYWNRVIRELREEKSS
jgi:hypothetical protein